LLFQAISAWHSNKISTSWSLSSSSSSSLRRRRRRFVVVVVVIIIITRLVKISLHIARLTGHSDTSNAFVFEHLEIMLKTEGSDDLYRLLYQRECNKYGFIWQVIFESSLQIARALRGVQSERIFKYYEKCKSLSVRAFMRLLV